MLRIVDRMRRRRANWMTRTDDEILEYLCEQGAGTPKSMSDDLGRNNNYLTTRCKQLTDYGLVEQPSRGFYTISDEGREYLAGELDASELEEN